MVLYMIFVLLGALCSLLLNLNEAVVKPDFSFVRFAKSNWLPTLTNVIVGCIIVISAHEEQSLVPVTKLSAFLVGAVAQQFFKKLCNIFLTSKPTKVGINSDEPTENE